VVPKTGLTQAYVGVTSGAGTSCPSVHLSWILVWSIFSFMWSAS